MVCREYVDMTTLMKEDTWHMGMTRHREHSQVPRICIYALSLVVTSLRKFKPFHIEHQIKECLTVVS